MGRYFRQYPPDAFRAFQEQQSYTGGKYSACSLDLFNCAQRHQLRLVQLAAAVTVVGWLIHSQEGMGAPTLEG